MIEEVATKVELTARAALAVLALGVNAAVIWYFYGEAIRKWVNKHLLDWWRKRWQARWNAKWEIRTETDG